MNKKIWITLVLLLLTAIYFVGSVTRSISNSTDNKDTLIRNSKGNYWEPTGENIQVAINDLGPQGGTVWLPVGTFNTASKISIASNTRLAGSGMGATIIRNDDANDARIAIIEAYQKNSFTISGLSIQGNRDSNPSSYNAFDIHKSSDFIIEDVYISNPTRNAIRVYDGCRRGIIKNVFAHDVVSSYHGIALGGSGTVCSDMIVDGAVMWDVNMQALDCANVQDSAISNIVITDSGYGIKVTGGATTGTFNTSFNNIVISDSTGGDAGLKVQFTRNCNFNNIFIDASNQLSAGIWIYGSFNGQPFMTYDSNFNNIHVKNAKANGIELWGKNINMNNIQVENSGNYGMLIRECENNTLSNIRIEDSVSSGIKIFDVDRLTLSGFSVSGSADGINSQGCSDLIITKGLIKGNSRHGIFLDLSSIGYSDFLVTDSVVTGNSGKGVWVREPDSNNYIITNNVLLGNTGTNLDDDGTGSNKLVTDNLE